VVPKIFRAVTQIEVTIKSYYPQYFAVIAHNIEQNCGFGSALPPEESHITPGGSFTPSLGITDLHQSLSFLGGLAYTVQCASLSLGLYRHSEGATAHPRLRTRFSPDMEVRFSLNAKNG